MKIAPFHLMLKTYFISYLVMCGFLLISGSSRFLSKLSESESNHFVSKKTTKLPLSFNEQHNFKILHITDMHYGESKKRDKKNTKLLRYLLNATNPDLLVVTGDLITGNAWNEFDPDFFEREWSIFTEVVSEYNVPYAYTLGNHDHQGDLNKAEIVSLDMSHPLSLMDSSERLGWASAYNVPIFSSYNSSALASNLWIFDTGDQYLMDISWGKITSEQMDWFFEKSNELKQNYGEIPMSLAFFHIPLPEYLDIWNEGLVYGDKNESVCCPSFVHGTFFEAFLENGITGVFCGHDHFNDYGGWKEGMELVYGRKTGYGADGPAEGLKRGARVIELKESYDQIQQKIIVKREHYLIEESGIITQNGPSSKRNYSHQKYCHLSLDPIFWSNYAFKVFDYSLENMF